MVPNFKLFRRRFINDVRQIWFSKTVRSNFQGRREQSSFTNETPKRSLLKVVAIGLSAGSAVGGAYAFYMVRKFKGMTGDEVKVDSSVLLSLPDVPISRHVTGANKAADLNLTLFQYTTCPFCCKVRAFLDFYGFKYDIVEVNPVLKQQTKWSVYKKVPILLARENDKFQQLNDSSVIISILGTKLKDPDLSFTDIAMNYPTSTYKEGGVHKVLILNRYFVMGGNLSEDEKFQKEYQEERHWRQWADDVLVHVLSPNVYRTREEALQAFRWFSEIGDWDNLFPKWERLLVIYMGAYVMWLIGKKLKKKHNLKKDVRQSLYDECNTWMKEVEKRGQFFGGEIPNLADLAVYGILSSIEGCEAFKELLHNTNIGKWYQNMKESVNNHVGSKYIA